MKKQTIICVDDEKIVLQSLKKEILNALNNEFSIEIAESGEEALEIFQELLDDNIIVPLIISDYIMPEMKGDELLRRVRLMNQDVYTIMLTGQATLQGVINSINNAGLYRYINKPWEQNDLSLTIQEAIKAYNKDIELNNRRKELEIANANLLKLDSAKTYFLGLLSHELKTPLIGINGNAKMIAEITDDSDIKECANDILFSEARLRKFADLSLLITRIQTDKYESTFYEENMVDLVDSIIYNLKDNIDEKKIEIVQNKSIDTIIRKVDSSLITKVFEIILDNALKFSNNNSKIHIDITTENNKQIIKISDQAGGFSEKNLESAFKLFVSSDDLMSHSEGTGLSLATAKVIMNFHNFEINAKNHSIGAEIEMIF